MMTPMLLMIVKLVFLLVNLMFLARLWRSLSSSRRNLRNLTMHASLKSLFLNFFAKCFFLFLSLSASVGYSST